MRFICPLVVAFISVVLSLIEIIIRYWSFTKVIGVLSFRSLLRSCNK